MPPELGGDASQFEEVMKELMDDTELSQHFQKLASMAGQIGESKRVPHLYTDRFIGVVGLL